MHIVGVWATAEVFDRTVLPSYLPRKPNGCFVLHNWNVDRAFQRAVIKPAIFTFDVTAKLIVRRFWLNDDSAADGIAPRSEEHTSELQSLMRISYAVFCLKKKKSPITKNYIIQRYQ